MPGWRKKAYISKNPILRVKRPECGGKDIETLPPVPAKPKDFLGLLLGLVKDVILLAVAREIPDDGDKAHVCRDCGCEW